MRRINWRILTLAACFALAALLASPGSLTAQEGQPAPSADTPTLKGEVVKWNDAALILRTAAGEVTLFLSPETVYLVDSLDPGLKVVVEYEEVNQAKLATTIRAAEK
jgi:hypothetical protein